MMKVLVLVKRVRTDYLPVDVEAGGPGEATLKVRAAREAGELAVPLSVEGNLHGYHVEYEEHAVPRSPDDPPAVAQVA